MNKWVVACLVIGMMCSCAGPSNQIEVLARDYIQQWKIFYPSRAFSSGDKDSAFRFEDISAEKVSFWIQFNQDTLNKLESLPDSLTLDEQINANLLSRQTLGELEQWEKNRCLENSPLFYTGLISQALTHILARDELTSSEKWQAVDVRLSGIQDISSYGQTHLKNGRPQNTQRSISILESTARFYAENLPLIARDWQQESALPNFQNKCQVTADAIQTLADHIRNTVQPQSSLPNTLGADEYARKLKIFTGMEITPKELEDIALKEIQEVRNLMEKLATDIWIEHNTDTEIPTNFEALLSFSIEAIESNREKNQADFLQLFIDLIDRAEKFIQVKDIATLPATRTLKTALSPSHFAGAAVGGVYSAGPFNPGAMTLLYLPTVADSAPESVKEGFYRSFNNHFNTMIITHEIYPGHYMQSKIASTNPHMVRSLFADGLYVEGWATLCEVITLDAGWNGFNTLDRFAHLRKRLENATRAYTSVQAHCRGWDRSQIHDFAVEKGLLAPQFALNLWDRVTASPLQLVSYFLGFNKFSEILESERKRLGDNFVMKEFCDNVLQAGAIPMNFLPVLLLEHKPNPN